MIPVRVVVIGWMPPAYNGRSHVVKSIVELPLSPEFDLVPFDSKLQTVTGEKKLPHAISQAARHLMGLPRFLKANRSEAVVLCTGPGISLWQDLLLMRHCYRAGLPVIVRFLGGSMTRQLVGPRSFRKRLILGTLAGARMFLAETREMVDDLRTLFPSIPARRVPNFIRVDELPALEGDSSHREPRVIYFGNMTPTKGVETLLACVDSVRDQLPATFHFVGGELEPGYLDHFRALVGKLRHPQAVVVHGRMEKAKVHDLARSCQVFGFPSRWPGEGQPAALIEAMGMGLVPVASRWRGIPEIVSDGLNGILIDEDHDSGAMSTQILRLFSDPALLSSLSIEARSMVREQYSVESANNDYLEIFEDVLNRSPRLIGTRTSR